MIKTIRLKKKKVIQYSTQSDEEDCRIYHPKSNENNKTYDRKTCIKHYS